MLKRVGNLLKSRSSVYLLAIFYIFAGINHFINPGFYLPLIPDYLAEKEAINIVSGAIEILLGLLVLMPRFRRLSSWLIIAMLVAFIPSHLYFIQIGSCVDEGLCVDPIIGWGRLIIIHPLLIIWAYYVGKS